MNTYKVAKVLMKRFEAFPVPPDVETGESNEIFHHPCFLESSEEERNRIMHESSLSKYKTELQKPWDRYFNVDLDQFLRGKEILDLGCFTGGRAIVWYEKYGLKRISGIDISQVYIDAARKFAEHKGANADFHLGIGEDLPFKEREFDAVLSYDVFEHVQDLQRTLNECYRILKAGGYLIAIFPGYYHPLEHHLDFVTKIPGIHYFFRGETLIKAYHEICEERGDQSYWYRRDSGELEDWERGNTLNGITLSKFRKMISGNDWRVVVHSRKSLGSLMDSSSRKISVRLISGFSSIMMRIPVLEEVFLNRIAYILQKPE